MDDSFAVQTALTGSEASYADKPDQSYVQVCYFIFATLFVFSRLVESFEVQLGPSQLLAQSLVPGVILLTHSALGALYLLDSLPLDTLGAFLGLALTAGPSNHCLTTLLRIAPGLFLVHLTGGYWYFYRTLAHSGCTVQRLSPYLTMIGEVCYRLFLLAAWVNSPISLLDFRFSLSGTSWMVALLPSALLLILSGFKPGIDGFNLYLLWCFFLLRGSCHFHSGTGPSFYGLLGSYSSHISLRLPWGWLSFFFYWFLTLEGSSLVFCGLQSGGL